MRILPLLVALVAVVVAFLAMQRVGELESKLTEPAAAPTEGHYEVAVVMGRIQQYHQKWWAAGQAGNVELAAFYLHELEESMEEVVEAGVQDDGIDVSQAMSTFGLPAIAELERLLKEEGVQAMHAKGAILVNACNACHQATGHAYIRIQEPSTVLFPDQDFRP